MCALTTSPSELLLSPESHQYTSVMLPIDIDVETQVWRGSVLTNWAPVCWIFNRYMHISPTAGSSHFDSFAMMLVHCKNTKTPVSMQFGAVGDLVWTFGCEKCV